MVGEVVHVGGVDIKILDPIDLALQRMYFAWKCVVGDSNALLAEYGLARAHHRILFVIARTDGITVGELLEVLGITAQGLQRPMATLKKMGMVVASRDPQQHRTKRLRLTEAGLALEVLASEAQKVIFRRAFEAAGGDAERGWNAVMDSMAGASLP